MGRVIKKAAVIGAGVMGSGIAAHLANAGIETYLLDIVLPELPKDLAAKGVELDSPMHRNYLAIKGIEKQVKSKLCGFQDKRDSQLVFPGNLEDDVKILGEVDWVIEAVTENPKVKESVFSKVDAHRKDSCIVSSNTSGIPLQVLTAGRSESFCENFLITHFFNPPRFMHLLELVKGEKTSPELYEFICKFASQKLGKGVVHCKDTPNFIANRIGCYDLISAVKAMLETGLSIEEVDALAGPLIGRPKSAVFRLLDMVGIDVIAFVVQNLSQLEGGTYQLPKFIGGMVQKGLLGSKVGKGFYQKVQDGKARRIDVIDLDTLEYREQTKPEFDFMKDVKKIYSPLSRVQALLALNNSASDFLWKTLSETLVYAAEKVPEISDSIYDVDNALKWGFNHEYGPFELWDALGVSNVCERLESEGRKVPKLIHKLREKGVSFYLVNNGRRQVYCPIANDYIDMPTDDNRLDLQLLKSVGRVAGDEQYSLLDAGNGVAVLEMHGKRNTLNMRQVVSITAAVSKCELDFEALVIATEQNDFSVGADLKEMIGAAMSGQLDEFRKAIERFQEMSMTIKHSSIPVVAAPRAFTFGGGCEISMHADAMQVSAETYMGLVECGVGLLPAGGGLKELALRASRQAGKDGDLFPILNEAFETVALAKVSGSGRELLRNPLSRASDGHSMNNDYQIQQAVSRAKLLASQGYRPDQRDELIRIGGKKVLAEFKARLMIMKTGGYISEHDSVIAEKVAYVLCGGDLDSHSMVTADYLLKLEREAFYELLQMPKTQERIQYTLANGKPLRN